jgi:UDP-glucose 4-epimerase
VNGKRVLVTGGAGFIGSHICERLIENGTEVVVLDNFSTGKLTNLEHIKRDLRMIQGKVENYNDVYEAIKDCDIIIHEAFPYGKSGMGLEEQYIEEGVIGTFNVLKASVKCGVEKVVNASSVAVYGIPKYLPLDEKHPINPFLPYGATKYAGELYCKTFSKLYGLDTVNLRYFYVYGPRYAQFDHSAMVNFLNRSLEDKPFLIYGDGSQIRDYTYIDDAVEGTLLAAMKENLSGVTYNISYGNGTTILELAKKVAKIVNNDIKVRFAETEEYKYSDEYCIVPVGLTKKLDDKWVDERNYVGDISKAKKELNYNPKVKIEEGIKRTIEWLKSLKGIEI